MTVNDLPIDALKAMIDLLRADTVVKAEVGSIRVYGQTLPAAITGEIDSEWAKHMPRPMVLVREAGGLEKTGVGPLSWPRFDVRCYGKEPGGIWEASKLSRIIFDQLFGQGKDAEGSQGNVFRWQTQWQALMTLDTALKGW